MVRNLADVGFGNCDEPSRAAFQRAVNSDEHEYEQAIKKLNLLQSNAVTIQKSENQGPLSHVQQIKKVESTAKYLSRIGISLETLDAISVIHIAGTKGKGTTAALCESILRHHGYRTGFYSSPHLISVRERIRINGVPLSQRKFVDYFDSIYQKLHLNKDDETDMPAYFKFLTVMAFKVFLQEEVDVAIVEVGLGGEYDCTNCIRKPAVVGITTLGLDHTAILGSTLPDIAWQKSGIFKPGARAFTVPQSSPAAMEILNERSRNRQCPLMVVPPLDSYIWDTPSTTFTHMIEDVYATNASIALQLARSWMQLQSPFQSESSTENNHECVVPQATPFTITSAMAQGLLSCSWPGRTQVLQQNNITYFLDGAHTEESILYCIRWFLSASTTLQPNSEEPHRILLFNVTKERDGDHFLTLLSSCNFRSAFFPKITAFPKQRDSSDQFSVLGDQESMVNYVAAWQRLSNKCGMNFDTVSEALEHIQREEGDRCHVLITGSVHLVGCALRVLDPTLSQSVTRVPVSLLPLQTLYSNVQSIL